MGTLYFLLPIGSIVFTLFYVVRRLDASSYLRRQVEATALAGAASSKSRPVEVSLEQRYVNWYTRGESISRKTKPKKNVDAWLVGTAIMPEGQAYHPEKKERRVVNM